MVKVNSIVSLLALGSSALAIERQPRPDLVEEFITCTTELAPKSNHHVPTYWHSKTRTLTYTERVTITPHPIITPTKTKTKTVTNIIETTTTEPPYTDVATTTITSTSYATTTNVVTQTDTSTISTTITTTPTTTIPAPADFTPISQEQGFVAKAKVRSAKNVLERSKEVLQCKKDPHGGHSFYPPLYPQFVTCNKLIEPVFIKRVTYTAKACTKTAPPKTKTVTTTVKKTHTDTIWPCEVTSTATSSTSTVVTSTVDSTITTTVTSTNVVSATAPQQTLQAVCGPENLISSANGGEIISLVETNYPGNFAYVAGVTDSYDCCLSCFNTPGCRGSFFAGTQCTQIVSVDGVCHANQFSQDAFLTSPKGPNSVVTTISNGPCGLIKNLGDASTA
ncbi:hypothetical protein M441DRAFT_63399 [Trichoderma asperellum CBS 433.97]|uniref:Apple domain-containing protein n=1 Tax=Trichoderma asperellum (strain ATCC 204424 / CBS 433.97 / NBRC 101777) TaxID=1042311 RepID=A0A2T3ZMS2_TRIA4|nr:hypothetical protein M441DRAFT_63399 [Trichoderma asperellum CBS 433.97]PTB46099.1 hypothetical protein M441DRAFT_63399 [Trichoderma asperellum CBS 433.97]